MSKETIRKLDLNNKKDAEIIYANLNALEMFGLGRQDTDDGYSNIDFYIEGNDFVLKERFNNY